MHLLYTTGTTAEEDTVCLKGALHSTQSINSPTEAGTTFSHTGRVD
uniref:Uncharacterized protein n=1 Tax=Anguilla anguilla TaxID=7936 RepID=A0A0E9XL62_ANGAN